MWVRMIRNTSTTWKARPWLSVDFPCSTWPVSSAIRMPRMEELLWECLLWPKYPIRKTSRRAIPLPSVMRQSSRIWRKVLTCWMKNSTRVRLISGRQCCCWVEPICIWKIIRMPWLRLKLPLRERKRISTVCGPMMSWWIWQWTALVKKVWLTFAGRRVMMIIAWPVLSMNWCRKIRMMSGIRHIRLFLRQRELT